MMAGRVDLSGTTVARANWRKLFAVRGFMALAREQAKLVKWDHSCREKVCP